MVTHLAESVMSLADLIIGEIGLRVMAVDTVGTIDTAKGMTEAIVGILDRAGIVVAMRVVVVGMLADRITGEVVIIVVVIRAEIVMVVIASTAEIAMVIEIVTIAVADMRAASAIRAEVALRGEM